MRKSKVVTMQTLKQMQFAIIKKLIAIDLIIIGISYVIMSKPIPFILGIIFGSAISVLNFIELANTLTRAITMPQDKAQSFTVIKYFIR